jgi:hypothetical protein
MQNTCDNSICPYCCEAAATVYGQGVTWFGQGAYDSAQRANKNP